MDRIGLAAGGQFEVEDEAGEVKVLMDANDTSAVDEGAVEEGPI